MQEAELRQQIQEFIRSFGLLAQDSTPCGQPLPPSQAHALQVLSETEMLSLQLLADRLTLDKSTASRLVSQLVERGWVERSPNPANRREVQLLLSPQGRAMAAELLRASTAKYGRILEHIPADRHRDVLEALALLTAAAKEG